MHRAVPPDRVTHVRVEGWEALFAHVHSSNLNLFGRTQPRYAKHRRPHLVTMGGDVPMSIQSAMCTKESWRSTIPSLSMNWRMKRRDLETAARLSSQSMYLCAYRYASPDRELVSQYWYELPWSALQSSYASPPPEDFLPSCCTQLLLLPPASKAPRFQSSMFSLFSIVFPLVVIRIDAEAS